PLTVIAVVGLFVGLARFEVAVAFYLAMPFVAAVVGLVLAVVSRSVSSFLCRGSASLFDFLGLEVGVDAVGVGDRELGEGLFPAC
ncbi:hypothetical protein M3697_17845, partial [Janibacter melonis]|uniref:hypothetical protein n=1 Tax=Janibacter melonis TaxID=262209 RepID=UPI002043B82D